jgi:hypothetical protein
VVAQLRRGAHPVGRARVVLGDAAQAGGLAGGGEQAIAQPLIAERQGEAIERGADLRRRGVAELAHHPAEVVAKPGQRALEIDGRAMRSTTPDR